MKNLILKVLLVWMMLHNSCYGASLFFMNTEEKREVSNYTLKYTYKTLQALLDEGNIKTPVYIINKRIKEITGYYDIKQKIIVIYPRLNKQQLKYTLYHELGHAEQQNYNIKEYVKFVYGEEYSKGLCWYTSWEEDFAEDYKCYMLNIKSKSTFRKYNELKFRYFFKNKYTKIVDVTK